MDAYYLIYLFQWIYLSLTFSHLFTGIHVSCLSSAIVMYASWGQEPCFIHSLTCSVYKRNCHRPFNKHLLMNEKLYTHKIKWEFWEDVNNSGTSFNIYLNPQIKAELKSQIKKNSQSNKTRWQSIPMNFKMQWDKNKQQDLEAL